MGTTALAESWDDQTPHVGNMANKTESLMSDNQEFNTEDKKAYLVKWALERAQGEVGRLPLIREARVEVRRRFGGGPGAGLGTNTITKVLKELKEELNKRKYGSAGVVGVIAPAVVDISQVPEAQNAQMQRAALIAHMMRSAGIQSMTIESDGEVLELRRFPRSL